MNDTKHTPLPWIFDEHKLEIDGYIEGNKVTVAEVFRSEEWDGHALAEDDGRLIVEA